MAAHSITLAWKIPWIEAPGGLQSVGSLRVRHDWATSLSLFTFMHWRRKWQPTPVFLPGESQGQGSLVGCHLWGRTESDTTEVMQQQQQLQYFKLQPFIYFHCNIYHKLWLQVIVFHSLYCSSVSFRKSGLFITIFLYLAQHLALLWNKWINSCFLRVRLHTSWELTDITI